MIVFLHQLKSRDNGPVLLFEIFAIIEGIDNVSCLLLLNRLTQQRVTSNGVTRKLVCYTAVFRVVTQCSSPLGETLRDDPKNGCVADYEKTSNGIKIQEIKKINKQILMKEKT